MNTSSSSHVPFVPACLSNPDAYDATIDLLYEDDPEATEKRAVVRREEATNEH